MPWARMRRSYLLALQWERSVIARWHNVEILRTWRWGYPRSALRDDVALLANFIEVDLAVRRVLDAGDQELELGLGINRGRHVGGWKWMNEGDMQGVTIASVCETMPEKVASNVWDCLGCKKMSGKI